MPEANNYLLPMLLIVPLLGAVVGAFIHNGPHARHWALMISVITFAVSVVLGFQFYHGASLEFFPVGYEIQSLGFGLHLRLDAVSLWLAILTTFLTPLAIAFSFDSIRDREREYYAWMNALLLTMLGVFVAGDVLLFLCFLRTDTRSDVFHHRHLGRPAAAIRRRQVLSIYLYRLRPSRWPRLFMLEYTPAHLRSSTRSMPTGTCESGR